MALLVSFQIYLTVCDWWHAIQLYNYSIQGFRVGLLSDCRLTTLSGHERWTLKKIEKKTKYYCTEAHVQMKVMKCEGKILLWKWALNHHHPRQHGHDHYHCHHCSNAIRWFHCTIMRMEQFQIWVHFFLFHLRNRSISITFVSHFTAHSVIFSKVIEFGANIYIVCNCDISDLKKIKNQAEQEKRRRNKITTHVSVNCLNFPISARIQWNV